jgi:hypothetical protein
MYWLLLLFYFSRVLSPFIYIRVTCLQSNPKHSNISAVSSARKYTKMSRGTNSILSEIEWDEGLSMPVANSENKALEDKVIQKMLECFGLLWRQVTRM